MPARIVTDHGQFHGLVSSWLLALEAENRSHRTLESYELSTRLLADWLTEHGQQDHAPSLTVEAIRGWLAHLTSTRSAETARTRYVGVRQFVNWCIAEGELDHDPMRNVPQPKVVHQPPDVIRPEEVRALLADCDGPSFADLRDLALILLFVDTGVRLSGLVGLNESDVSLRERVARVRLKGGRELLIPFGARTARALDRYLRAKKRQAYGERDWLWLSSTSKGRLTNNGVQQMLRRRGRRLGLHLHPHRFRHGFADSWLRAGGSETGLMNVTGWKSRQMVGRYAAALAEERAREEHRRLSPADNL